MAVQKFAYVSVMALVAAAAATPAAAYDGEGRETVRAERNWNGAGRTAQRAGRGGDSISVDSESRTGNRTTGRRGGGRGGDADSDATATHYTGRSDTGRNRGYDEVDDAVRRGREYDAAVRSGRRDFGNGLDRREAERIARAHREAPAPVEMRRDRHAEYYDGVPSYRTRHHRRRWWRWGW